MKNLDALIGVLTIGLGLALGNILTEKVDSFLDKKYQVIEVLPKKDRPAFKVTSEDYMPNEFSPPVILLVETNETSNPSGVHCSGTVISNEYVVTAAHCLLDENGKLLETIIIKNAISGKKGLDSIQNAIPVGVNKRADYGLVKGNFTLFSKSLLDVSMTTIIDPPGSLSLCGNGWGTPFTCYPIFNSEMCGDKLCFKGSIVFPAMSGGAVISSSPYGPILFAVNKAYTDNSVVASPLVGLFETLDVEVVK